MNMRITDRELVGLTMIGVVVGIFIGTVVLIFVGHIHAETPMQACVLPNHC